MPYLPPVMRIVRAVLCLLGLLILFVFSRAPAAPAARARLKFVFLNYVAPGDQLFGTIHQGARDAAKALEVDVDFQFADLDPVKLNNLIETAISNKVDGIAITITDPNAYTENVCKAIKAGIPVIAFNVDDPQGAQHSCRMAFVGQDFVRSGYALGKRLVEQGNLKTGDVVFTPVEFPEASYATLRHQGIAQALTEKGVKTEMVGTGNNPSEVLTKMTQYLLGHPKTAGVVTLGSVTGRVVLDALKEVGMKVPVATYDNSTEIMAGIKSGAIVATADQQPYEQGFYPVVQMYLYARYRLYPADIATGGIGLTDQKSIQGLDIGTLMGKYR